MEQTTIFLSQATAKAYTEGILSEIKLEIVKDEKDGGNKVEGYITIKTDDINYTTYNITAKATTKASKPSKSYENLVAFMERAHSIAEVGEEEATKVRVNGQVNPWTSFNQMGAKTHKVGYKTGFVSIISELKDPRSTFEVECFVQSVDDEFDKETQVPTGRAILHTLLPIYNNGIEPLDIVVPQEYAMACKQLFTQPGCQSAHIVGNIGNTKEEKKTTVEYQIGGAVTKTQTKNVNELILTHAGTMEQQYELETIQRAIAEYDLVLESKKKRAMEGNNAGGNKTIGGATTGASAAAGHRNFGF